MQDAHSRASRCISPRAVRHPLVIMMALVRIALLAARRVLLTPHDTLRRVLSATATATASTATAVRHAARAARIVPTAPATAVSQAAAAIAAAAAIRAMLLWSSLLRITAWATSAMP